MRKHFRSRSAAVLSLLGLSFSLVAGPVQAQQPPADLKLKVGDVAPDFTLHYFDGNDLKDVKLSD